MKFETTRNLLRTLVLLLCIGLIPSLVIAGGGKKKKKNDGPKPDAIIHTSFGDISVRLYEDTPLHRENFLKLAHEHFYDSTTFHRVMSNFMIQGGDPYSKDPAKANMAGTGGPGYTIPAEFVAAHYHHKGALAAARTPDQMNPKRASSGSQFYIVQGAVMSDSRLNQVERHLKGVLGKDFAFSAEAREAYKTIGGYPPLDGQYTVFGEVLEGLDVLDKIAAVETGARDRPKVDVRMTIEAKTKLRKKKKKKKAKKKKVKKEK